MKFKYLRIATFIVAALLATGLTAQGPIENPDPNPGGAGGVPPCQTCYGAGGGSYAGINCGSPFGGGWGTDYCYIDHSDPQAAYCFSVGHDCCVD
jgi:hypothetical protein